jgi:hypothetical protein
MDWICCLGGGSQGLNGRSLLRAAERGGEAAELARAILLARPSLATTKDWGEAQPTAYEG